MKQVVKEPRCKKIFDLLVFQTDTEIIYTVYN